MIIDGTGTQSDPYLISLPSGGTENQVLGITDGVPGWIDNSGTNTNLNTYSGENLNGDYYSNEHIIVSGNVSGDLNPTTVNSGSPMDPITVPNGKIYNIKVLYNNQSGTNHKSAFRIDNQPIWGNDSNPGLVNFTMHEGQTLTHVYGGWNGYNGSYSDSYYVKIEVLDKPSNLEVIIINGNVSGDLNPTTVNSGSPMDPITVPNGKIYNIKVLYNNQSGTNHKSAFRIDNQPIWGNDSNPGLVNFIMHEGQTLTHGYGGWNGYNGSYSDSYFVVIESYQESNNSSTGSGSGNGIASSTNNGDGTFTLTFDDGTTFTTDDLTGPQGIAGNNGADGNGIESASNNGDGTFTLTFDDGTTFTTDDLTGPQGPQGQAGTLGAPINYSQSGEGLYFPPQSFGAGWQNLTLREDTYSIDLDPGTYSIGLKSNWGSTNHSGGFSGKLAIGFEMIDPNGDTVSYYTSTDVFNVSFGGIGNTKVVVNGADNFNSTGKFIAQISGTYNIKVTLNYSGNNVNNISGTLNNYNFAITNMY